MEKRARERPGKLYRLTPMCDRCHIGYCTVVVGPRGGVKMLFPCVSCGYQNPKPAGGYIPLRPPRTQRKRASNAKASKAA